MFQKLIRKIGLIKLADKMRFYLRLILTYKERKAFIKENHEVKLPPPYFMYETFNLNYNSFYFKSIETAEWIKETVVKYIDLKDKVVLDWGCGPGRVTRHLPTVFGENNNFFGTDYNERYIDWCSKNLKSISFQKNSLTPPMNYEDSFFDLIISISIFTHLSLEKHYLWMDEILRILKPGGIAFITSQGEVFKYKLSKEEQTKFDKGELVIKAQTKEGHRTYSAFQPDSFIKSIIKENSILEHIKGGEYKGKLEQDVWIIQKKA